MFCWQRRHRPDPAVWFCYSPGRKGINLSIVPIYWRRIISLYVGRSHRSETLPGGKTCSSLFSCVAGAMFGIMHHFCSSLSIKSVQDYILILFVLLCTCY